MSTTTKPAHLSHDPEIILDSCEACCWEQYGTPAEFEREHREYQAMLHNLAEHGPNSRVRMQAHDLLTQIALSEAETDFEKYKIHRAADEWVRGEAVREAAEARAAAQTGGYIWDFWVESDLGNTAGMQAEHARRFPDCPGKSGCPHISY